MFFSPMTVVAPWSNPQVHWERRWKLWTLGKHREKHWETSGTSSRGNCLMLYRRNTWPEVSSIQFSSVTQSFPTLWDPMNCSTPGFPVHHKLPKLAQTHVCWVGEAIQPTHPLLSPSLSAFSLSRIRVFSSGSVLCIKCPKYWSFSFSISLMNVQDWFPLGLTVWLNSGR